MDHLAITMCLIKPKITHLRDGIVGFYALQFYKVSQADMVL